MPKYYTKAKHKECITEMREHFGDYAVFCFCLCNAYKYAYRGGLKAGNTAIQDYTKLKWYKTYAQNLKDKHRFNVIYLFKYKLIDKAIEKAVL